MTTNASTKTIRPAMTDGKISTKSMIIALVRSGVPLGSIKLTEQLTADELASVKEELAN